MPDNSNRIPRSCEVCGAAFLADAHRISKGQARFCSMACYGRSIQVPKLVVACARCGKEYTINPNLDYQHRKRFCSKSCAMGDPPEELRCPICDTLFMAFPSSIASGRRYCSKRCESVGQRKRIVNICGFCGTTFETTPCGKRPYCSRTCASHSHLDKFPSGPAAKLWKGGRRNERLQEMSRAAYRDWRTAVYVRDDYSCQECGRRGHGAYLNAHHRVPWADNRELRFDVANGVTLCRECHSRYHRGVPRPGQIATP